ncbi:SDR family NAD(P)-dependent oxidoreductase [Propionibacteriaceae bacterium Y2011]|uniref:SDR family NAD(P)-dependent oxidoreductase n=1 Tax=Microlunatus sp. Y2014 TaxID=3418488 RepID=UPI003B491C2D
MTATPAPTDEPNTGGAGATSPVLPTLAGRRVLVTGAASGIGEATVAACRARGATVAGFDVAEVAEPADDGVRHFVCSVADEDAVRDRVADAVAWLGGLDSVLHVAGIIIDAQIGVDELSLADWETMIGVDLTGAFLVAKHTLPHLARSPHSSLVLTGSGAGVHNAHASVSYAAAKGGLNGLAITLEETWRRRGVSVIALLVGSVDTPLVRRFGSGEEARNKRKAENLLLESAEVGALMAFLASPDGSAVRGPVRTW